MLLHVLDLVLDPSELMRFDVLKLRLVDWYFRLGIFHCRTGSYHELIPLGAWTLDFLPCFEADY